MSTSNTAAANKIEIKNLTVNYIENKKSFNALNDVSFGVGRGEFVSVIGASGCASQHSSVFLRVFILLREVLCRLTAKSFTAQVQREE